MSNGISDSYLLGWAYQNWETPHVNYYYSPFCL